MKRNFIAGAVTVAVAVIAAGLVYWFGVHARGLRISIVFDRADGIGQDSKIVLRGVPVGEVEELKRTNSGDVVVDARVYREYKDRVNSSSVFIIESPDVVSEPDEK